MEKYISLLFPNKTCYLNFWEKSIDKDINLVLNINMITNALKEINYEFPEEYLITFNNDEDISTYRLEIMNEFYLDRTLSNQFTEIINKIYFLQEEFELINNSKKDEQKWILYISIITKYIDCLESTFSILNRNNISTGFNNLYTYLSNIVNSNEFINMKEEVDLITDKFKDILNITLNISYIDKQFLIENDTEETKNLSRILKELFYEVFESNIFTDFSCVQHVPISAIEDLVINKLKDKYQNQFIELENFYNNYNDIDIFSIISLRKELIFYTTYLKFVEKFESVGLRFCIPEFNSELYHVKETFDLGLAVKLLNDNKINTSLVTNDIQLEIGNIFIITGPNQGGKTTYLRHVGLLSLLSQAGCLIPGTNGKVIFFNQILIHFLKEESIGINQGRLAEEINNIKDIQEKITKRSLVLINEPFSSTRRIEGTQLLETFINNLINKECLCGITTHFYEIALQNSDKKNIISLIAEVDSNELKRTYKIVKGLPNHSIFLRDLVEEAGLTYPQLLEMIKRGDD